MPLILLNGHEMGARLGVSYQTVLDWARMGKIPSIKTGRGRVVFNLDQVVEALEEKQAGPKLAFAAQA